MLLDIARWTPHRNGSFRAATVITEIEAVQSPNNSR
jgi:hypothetical protein